MQRCRYIKWKILIYAVLHSLLYCLFQQMDELTLSLTGGTNGYKIQLRDLYVRGASNYTVEDIKLGSPFQAVVRMPALILDAHYSR